jgi:hypothetical protein
MKRIRVVKTLPVLGVWFKDHASNDAWGAEAKGGLEEIFAVGILTHQDDEKLVIARMAGMADSVFEGTLTIAVSCITRVKHLAASPIPIKKEPKK